MKKKISFSGRDGQVHTIELNIGPFKTVKDRFIFFFLLGITLMVIFSRTIIFSQTVGILFMPLIMLPMYILNIITNLNSFDLFNVDFFWAAKFGNSQFLQIVFIILGAICFSIILTILSGKNEKVKKIMLYFLFIFFSLSLILKGYLEYSITNLSNVQRIGSGNLPILLGELSIIFTNIIILTHINKKVNLTLIIKIFKKYLFGILQLLVTLFFGLLFIKMVLAPDANKINLILIPIYYFALGFFFFLILELRLSV